MLIRPRPRRQRWRAWLAPLAAAYAGAVTWRNHFYDKPANVYRAAVPVISVGNLTVGGTGKTPTVIAVVQHLLDLGRRPAILTRGYAARRGQTPDEVQEFHTALPAVPVIVNADRRAGADAAVAEHAADCLVLDDGFQHRALGRDLDVVLIDALDPWGGGHVLPRGNLREPRAGLQRSQLIVITRSNHVSGDQLDALEGEIASVAPGRPCSRASVETVGLVNQAGESVPLSALNERGVQPVCGVGNPEGFRRQLELHATGVRYPLAFPDHHHYTTDDVRGIRAVAADRTADVVVTTRKDWGKLAPLWPADAAPPLWRLDVRLALDTAQLEPLLRQILETAA